MADRSARTEKPTARRLDEARKKGQVPRTNELSAALSLGAFLVFAHLLGGDWLAQMKRVMAGGLMQAGGVELTPASWFGVVGAMASTVTMMIFMPVATLATASLTGRLVQGKPSVSFKPLKPDWSRLKPMQGLKKIFRLKALVDVAKTIVKVTLITTIAYTALRDALDGGLPGDPGAEGALLAIATLGGKVILRVALLLLALALIDLLYTRWDHVRGLMMTKEEVKEERKQLEGDPRVKSRIRSKQFQTARARMMADVPGASVVVTNPTHYAVALRYVQDEMDVPQVVAKGRDLLARRIREIASANGVPIVRDPTLARALYRSVPVGGFIPVALFRAVAEVLALVMRGHRRRLPTEARP